MRVVLSLVVLPLVLPSLSYAAASSSPPCPPWVDPGLTYHGPPGHAPPWVDPTLTYNGPPAHPRPWIDPSWTQKPCTCTPTA